MENTDVDSDSSHKDNSLAAELLFRCGMTRSESKIYISLLDLGPTPARELVSILGINRVELYRVLKRLSSRGLIEVKLGRPNSYGAVDPFLAVKNLIAESEDRLRQIRERAGELVMMLEATRSQKSRSSPVLNDQVYFSLKGGRQIIWQWKEMMLQAKHEILRVWSDTGLKLHDREGFLEILARCRARGVKIRGITEVSKSNLPEVEEWTKIIDLRHKQFGPAPLRYMIVDGREVIISTSFSAEPRELTALYTNQKALVDGLRVEFEDAWKTSLPSALVIKQMKKSENDALALNFQP